MIREIKRIPAERNTKYEILRKFDEGSEPDDELDKVTNTSQFGSYTELIKINKFNYENPEKNNCLP